VLLSVLTLLAAPAFASAAAPAKTEAKSEAASDWTLDLYHSRVGFVVKHLGVTNVRGEFKEFATPVLKGDAQGKISALEATASAKSVSTGIDKRDEHLRGDDFFNAEKFPTEKLVLKSLKWDGDKFTADVEVTLRDKTKIVKFEGEKSPVTRVDLGQGPTIRVGYSASGKINRKEFGLNWSKVIESVNVVADEVKLELELELFKKA
jgi:polyisoprenoid-binding protein YceI